MSEDGSPAEGQQPNQQEVDQNSSLMDIVCSRVTSIIPQSFSKWFSPTAAGDEGSRNGGVRRRHEEKLDGESYRNVDDSDCEEVDVVDRPPPTKRSKLNVSEEYSSTDSFQITQPNTSNNFLSSTPTTIHRGKHLGLKSVHQPPNNYNTSVPSSAVASRSISELRSLTDYDAHHTDILEVISEHRDITNEFTRHTSSRRHLNIPRSTSALRNLRRPSLKTIRGSGATASFNATSSSFLQNVEEDDNQDDLNIEEPGKRMENDLEKIIANGVRSSPNIITVDTTSESGESQSSSVQKKRGSGLFGAGTKRLRTSTSSGLNYATHLQGKKSLFCDKNMPSNLNNSTTSLTSLNRRQSFNASLYGSTSALSDSRLLNKYSPFYNGCTTYGGASAYSKYSQNAQRTIRMPTLIRPSSSMSTFSSSTTSLAQTTDSTSALSNTAKRILELMNQFTTPLGDAKKMANNTKVPTLTAHRQRFSDVDRTTNRGIRMAMPKTPYSRLMGANSNSKQQLAPPINELQVPSMSQLLQMKKLQNNTEKVREITNLSKSVLNREEVYKLPTDKQNADNASAKHVNKIKNKLTSSRSSTKSGNGTQEAVQSVGLPDISLPLLESVPKIDIEISKPFSKIQSSEKLSKAQVSQPKDLKSNTSSTLTFSSTVKSFSKSQSKATSSVVQTTLQKGSNTISNVEGFTFSSPIEVASALAKDNVEPISNFKFSDPFLVSSLLTASNSASNFKYQLNNDNNKPKPIISNTAAAGMTVSTQLKSTGSVLDAFKNVTPTKKTLASTSSFGDQFKVTSDKWECSVCMVHNDNSADQCVACENARKKLETTGNQLLTENQLKPDIKNSFGDKFKPSSDSWECSTCMIRNKSDISECIACNMPKSGATKPPSTTSVSLFVSKTTDAGFKSIVAQQSEKWKCSACMARNESNRNKCICCGQTKPGAVNDSVPKFSFGTTASKFTFGFSDKKEEELKSINIEITPATSAVETKSGLLFGAKPAEVSESPSFSFGSKPVVAAITPATVNKEETDKPAASTFKFGISGQDAKPEPSKTQLDFKSPPVDKKEAETTSIKFGTSAVIPSFSSTSAKAPNDTKESSSSSIFKPIGGFAFGNKDRKEGPVKPIFGFGTGKITTDTNKPATPIGGFSLTNSLLSKADDPAPQDSKNLFSFASPTTANETKPAEKSSGFSFGSSATTSAFKSPLSQKASSESTIVATKTELTSAPTFVFGKSSTSVSVTPTFGAISSNAITSSSSSNVVSTASSFGGLASTVSSSTVSSCKSTSNPGSVLSTPSFGSSPVTAAQPQQTLKFGNSFSASNSSTPDNKTTNNLYSFGGGNKAETATPMFGNVSSTTATPNKLFAFGGANTSTTSAPTTTPSSGPFLFGAASIQKPTESAITIFGSTTNPTQNNTNSAVLPAFGSFASPLTTPQQSQTPAFGQSSAIPTPFGTNVNNNASGFGAATAAPMFGSSAAVVPTFGGTSSAFGATSNSTFGTTPMKASFGNSFGASATQTVDESSAAKKPAQGFNFSVPAQNAAATFSFGTSNNNNNNNNNKQPFAFSASSAPTFNFTGNSETAANAPFQFSAAQAANNIFAVTPGAPQTAQPLRRKPRTAVTRRTQQR